MKFILRKILTLIITLFIVSLLAFLAFQVIPGSPATSMLGTNATPETVAELEAELGLDTPFWSAMPAGWGILSRVTGAPATATAFR